MGAFAAEPNEKGLFVIVGERNCLADLFWALALFVTWLTNFVQNNLSLLSL